MTPFSEGDREKLEKEGSSTARLVIALSDAGHERMAQMALAGYYHDYLSPSATPKIMLVAHLEQVGSTELAERVKAGEFDEGYADAQEWWASEEGQDIARRFEEQSAQRAQGRTQPRPPAQGGSW